MAKCSRKNIRFFIENSEKNTEKNQETDRQCRFFFYSSWCFYLLYIISFKLMFSHTTEFHVFSCLFACVCVGECVCIQIKRSINANLSICPKKKYLAQNLNFNDFYDHWQYNTHMYSVHTRECSLNISLKLYSSITIKKIVGCAFN